MYRKSRNGDSLTCNIEADQHSGSFTGIIKYNGFESGVLSAPNAEGVRSQFQVIEDIVDHQGAMVRLGIIMIGYHNDELRGEVLLVNGELLGSWYMDEFETSFFTAEGPADVTHCAPSAWMLHDLLAKWVAQNT